jgi:hypothetical protein
MRNLFPFNVNERVLTHWYPEIVANGVSKRARAPGQFIEQYLRYGPLNLPENWKEKRQNFLLRTYAQYRLQPTYRRRLALLAWAYDPSRASETSTIVLHAKLKNYNKDN